uniref:Sushi domain-containing protein n=3 Tax=Ciona intestinalis TaxID=7719 RepID=F6ZGC5_CIOIN
MTTFLKISVLAIFAISMVAGQGGLRKCWFCENARNFLDCLDRGRQITCKQPIDVCYAEFQSTTLTMGCKENSRTQSCTVQVGQNPTQCRVPFRTTASHTPNRCTCCCDEDYCNQAFDNPCMEITELPECTPVPAPGNGTKSCTNPDDNLIPGTECWFECNSGFYAEGPTHTTCELNSARTGASFTNRGPRCIPLCPQNAVLDVVFAIEISTSASSVQTLKEISAAV